MKEKVYHDSDLMPGRPLILLDHPEPALLQKNRLSPRGATYWLYYSRLEKWLFCA